MAPFQRRLVFEPSKLDRCIASPVEDRQELPQPYRELLPNYDNRTTAERLL